MKATAVTRALALILATVGCESAPPAESSSLGCPPEAVVEELHAAAFHFQHGPLEVGRDRLANAKRLVGNGRDREVAELVAKLAKISERAETDPEWRQLETDAVRATLADWKCLPDALHTRLHRQLPPI